MWLGCVLVAGISCAPAAGRAATVGILAVLQ